MVNDIRLLALDIDGVLTDGSTTVGAADAELKRISFHDLDAVAQARRSGLEIALVTGEDNARVNEIAGRFDVKIVRKAAKDKLHALSSLATELKIPLAEICYVGDSDRDAPALARVGLGLAPANATPVAKAAAHRTLTRQGGNGAVAEAVRLLLDFRATRSLDPAGHALVQEVIQDSIAAHQRMLAESAPLLGQVADLLTRAIGTGHKILLFGNGGSAADAQHVAGELMGRFLRDSDPWPAIALTTDSSVLTCIGNDWEFNEVFARQVRALARPGDVVVGITTSGRSPNVLRALDDARKLGARTVGFTGQESRGLAEKCDVCFCAPAAATPRIQELHLLAWHIICQLVETRLSEVLPRTAT